MITFNIYFQIPFLKIILHSGTSYMRFLSSSSRFILNVQH